MPTSIDVTIEGTVPLLQHRFPEEPVEKKTTKKTGRIDYEAEGELSLYQLDDGTIYQPATHIEQSMVRGATSFQIPGKGKLTYKSLFQAAVFVEPDCIEHKKPKWIMDKRAVIVNRARVWRYRPRFDEWALDFSIVVLDEQLAPEVVREVLDQAGSFVGIGDFRPKFGRFSVTSWAVNDGAG